MLSLSGSRTVRDCANCVRSIGDMPRASGALNIRPRDPVMVMQTLCLRGEPNGQRSGSRSKRGQGISRPAKRKTERWQHGRKLAQATGLYATVSAAGERGAGSARETHLVLVGDAGQTRL